MQYMGKDLLGLRHIGPAAVTHDVGKVHPLHDVHAGPGHVPGAHELSVGGVPVAHNLIVTGDWYLMIGRRLRQRKVSKSLSA